jgi:hypothetical protein
MSFICHNQLSRFKKAFYGKLVNLANFAKNRMLAHNNLNFCLTLADSNKKIIPAQSLLVNNAFKSSSIIWKAWLGCA